MTTEGERYDEHGLPEIRLYRAAVERGAEGSVPIGELLGPADLDGPAVEIALSNFARKGYGEIENGAVSVDSGLDPDSDAEACWISWNAVISWPARSPRHDRSRSPTTA